MSVIPAAVLAAGFLVLPASCRRSPPSARRRPRPPEDGARDAERPRRARPSEEDAAKAARKARHVVRQSGGAVVVERVAVARRRASTGRSCRSRSYDYPAAALRSSTTPSSRPTSTRPTRRPRSRTTLEDVAGRRAGRARSPGWPARSARSCGPSRPSRRFGPRTWTSRTCSRPASRSRSRAWTSSRLQGLVPQLAGPAPPAPGHRHRRAEGDAGRSRRPTARSCTLRREKRGGISLYQKDATRQVPPVLLPPVPVREGPRSRADRSPRAT